MIITNDRSIRPRSFNPKYAVRFNRTKQGSFRFYAWQGPRGRNLCGTGKNLARLAWDLQRNS